MNKEKGQIQIVIIILVIIGVVFFANLPKLIKQLPKTGPSSRPSSQQEIISPSQEQEPSTPIVPSGPDTTSPQRSHAQPDKDLPSNTRKTMISLETNERAICKYSTVSGMHYDSMNRVFSETDKTFHSTEVTGLFEGEEYKYYIKCIDQSGNKNTNDFKIAFEVKEPEDVTPPKRRNPYPTGDVFPAGTDEVTISVSTDEPAYCRYSTEQGKTYSKMPKRFSRDDEETYHTAKITNYEYYVKCEDEDADEDCRTRVRESLENGKTYDFFVRCKDLEGNANTGDVMIQFSIREQ